MNYITQLQSKVTDLNSELLARAERIQEFREHLASPKFAAVTQDGSRGDWISTADVSRWLRYIENPSSNAV